MSGFVSELLVFLGVVTSNQYSFAFKAGITVLEGIGTVLTPIYLLSMLRQLFYGYRFFDKSNPYSIDPGPRELFNPLSVLRQAVRGVTPDVVTETKRVGGSTYRVPIEVVPAKGKALAIRWSLIACRKRSGRSMALRSSDELIDAARNSGSAIRKKEETHKVAEANKAFSHFR
ncbi:hypothetical protein GOP47_0014780 [Adiantum capillus-veneris]|uniref:Small ribosomal subunit protein uS7 domain-containing protein n=1 Tax=Adiantum capillus-veneris TaxID=13818 RepID=A0A9D4UMZ9_ADICA|nr:hypothetical protein GOP47_0014780 [Adiantum capillus-veneris]